MYYFMEEMLHYHSDLRTVFRDEESAVWEARKDGYQLGIKISCVVHGWLLYSLIHHCLPAAEDHMLQISGSSAKKYKIVL
jgi:hypothetical protein